MIKVFRAKSNDNSDVSDVSDLFDQYRVFYKMDSDLKAATKFINERLIKNDSIIYLAKHSEKPCGFIQIYPAFSSVAMKPIWVLNDLFVNKNFRQKGCASALMEHIKIEAKKQNIFSIKLATAVDNVQAKKLYLSINYKKIESFENYSLKI